MAASCLTQTGCGTGAYEALMQKRLAEIQTAAPFTQLFGAGALPETPVKVRVPQVFKNSFAQDSPHPDDGEKIDPRRFEPPFLSLPGIRLCYEQTAVAPTGEQTPYYCYLAAFQANPGAVAGVAADIQTTLNNEFPNSPAVWQDVVVKTAAGGDLTWRKIRVTGEMPVDIHTGDGNPDNVEFKKLPGAFELWIYEVKNWVVLIGWREVDAVADKSNLAALAPLTAGTVEIGEMPPPAEAAAAK